MGRYLPDVPTINPVKFERQKKDGGFYTAWFVHHL
jgi:hypothetical protein